METLMKNAMTNPAGVIHDSEDETFFGGGRNENRDKKTFTEEEDCSSNIAQAHYQVKGESAQGSWVDYKSEESRL